MKPDKFIDAMGNIDEDIIEEYQNTKKIRSSSGWIKFASIASIASVASVAASLIFVFSVSLIIWQLSGIDLFEKPDTTETVIIDPSEEPNTTHKDFKIVSVSAEKQVGNFISGDTSFVVKTENGTAEDVRTHLYISSGPEYTVEKIDNETFKVSVSDTFSDNTVVNLSYVNNGIIDTSWAFQTEGKLSLSGSYPKDGTKTAAVNTAIELEFSYASAEGIEDAVTFEPEISGSWVHAGKIWRFVPDAPLEKDTTYTINVGNEITADGKKLDKEATVTFSTYEEQPKYSVDPSIITVDGINSYLPGGNITIRVIGSSEGMAAIDRISVDQFDTYIDMIDFSEGETAYKAKKFKDVDFTSEMYSGDAINITIGESLPQGYYVARAYSADGTHLFDWIIQVHPLSVYVAVTERDILVWTAENGEVASGIPVRFLDSDGKTGKDGTLLMEDVTDGSGETKYLYVGDMNDPFVMGSPSFTHNNYPRAYVYTDKPKYKTTDTIKVWGMIPLDLFYDEPDGKFEVMLGEETDTAVDITPDENGTFECEIDITRHKEASPSVYLKYNGTVIGSRWVKIYNYSLKNYTFEPIIEKNFAENGENLELGVRVTHVSGIAVEGKEVCLELENGAPSELFAITDESGTAHFTITPENYEKALAESSLWLSTFAQLRVTIRNSNSGESYNADISEILYIVTCDGMGAYSITDDEMLRVQTFYHDLEGKKTIGTDGTYSGDLAGLSFCGDPYNGEVSATISMYKVNRVVADMVYSELTKTYTPVYEQTSEKIKTVTETVKSKNGEALFDLIDFEIPESTETERYYTTALLRYEIPGREIFKNIDIDKNYFVEENTYTTSQVGISKYSPNTVDVHSMPHDYHMYTYALVSDDSYSYSYGHVYGSYNDSDTVSFRLKKYTDEPVDGGKLLYFIYGQSVREMKITDSSEFDITFGHNTFPHANLGAVYFKDGVFHRVANAYIKTDYKERELEFEITADKEEYAPGDKVTVTVALSAEKIIPGATLAGTAVNVSVVNEGVYTYFDSTNIASTIQMGTTTRDYFFSSYRDYDLVCTPGGWGGGGGNNAIFSDTAYFGSAVTDKDGKCTITFTLPENVVTSYRITVHAANKDLYSGADYINVEAKSDFFVQPGEVKHAKAADDLAISASLITAEPGTAQMTFRINELDIEKTVSAVSGRSVFANFGKVPAGDYTVTVSAVSDSSDEERSHSITFPVTVETSTLKITESNTVDIGEASELEPVTSPTTLRFMTEEGERYNRYVAFADSILSERLDTVVAGYYSDIMARKLSGSTIGATNLSVYDYRIYREDVRETRLKLLKNGEDDPVMSALYAYLSGDTYYSATTPDTADEAVIVESLLNRAALGSPVLVDLLYAKDNVSDDPYVHTILSLAFAMCGDTANAKEVLLPLGDNVTEGERALYALALVFTDRTAAAKELDRLVAEDPTETYLAIATYIYMKNGEAQIGEEASVTVKCGEREIPVTVQGIYAKTVVLTTTEGDVIYFEDADEDIRISYSYESTFTPKENERHISGLAIAVPSEPTLFHSAEITVDLTSVLPEGEYSGRIKLALPNCFRDDTKGTSSESNVITKYVSVTNDPGSKKISIPVIAVAPGNYILEPVIFTVDGVNYYSDAVEINITE